MNLIGADTVIFYDSGGPHRCPAAKQQHETLSAGWPVARGLKGARHQA